MYSIDKKRLYAILQSVKQEQDRKMTIEQLIKISISKIADRFEAECDNYPYINTKFDILSGRDFGANDEPFRRKDCIYSWIQGRGIESLAKHISYFRETGEDKLAERLTSMLHSVVVEMEKLRALNNGRLPFAMRPDGSSFFPRENYNANYSDLFFSKGLFAASQILKDAELQRESESLFSFVTDAIEKGEFHTDQQCFDPKNKVVFVPGKFPQGPRMIALGGIADLIEAQAENEKWINTAERFISFILDHHINSGQYDFCQKWDFIESVDASAQPWMDNDQLFCDPGHALEFIGLAGKCLMVLKKQKRCSELIEHAGTVLPQVFTHVFDYGFNPIAGGICKGYDLTERRIINSDMPWWNLPETVRAGFILGTLYPENNKTPGILLRSGRALQAFIQGYLQPNGFGCQTRNARGEIINVIPAVSDADPGYHTNLSLMDALKLFQ